MATVTTSHVGVNAAFLQEIKDLNEELWQLLNELRGMCSQPAASHMERKQLAEGLARLRDNLAMHFSLEEFYGYLADAAPRLGERAQQLRAEHRDLYVEITAIAAQAERGVYEGHSADHWKPLALRFMSFLDQFERHELHEDELILEAFDDDIGVGD